MIPFSHRFVLDELQRRETPHPGKAGAVVILGPEGAHMGRVRIEIPVRVCDGWLTLGKEYDLILREVGTDDTHRA